MKMNFTEWRKRVDRLVSKRIGLGIDDLEDRPYRDWYDDELTPAEAAGEVLDGIKEEYGYDP